MLFQKLEDPLFLPTRSQLERAFGVQGFRPQKLSRFYLDRDKPVHSHEVLNREMIRELSLYFVDRISSLIARQDAEVPIPIVEVGAGTGRLSYFLRQSIDRLLPGCAQFHPIDSGEDGIISLAETDILDAAQAMDTYQPSLVICSWMAPKVDLTPIFRGNPSVREYILLGEKACCGKYPETWSAKDGFTAIDLVGIQKHQIGSMDQHMNRDKAMGNISSAVAFRRISL